MSSNLVPDYIPPHLRGKVDDFRNEDDGSISFNHPEAYNGLGPEESRIRLTPDQYKMTFDRDYRNNNFSESMRGQYALRYPKTGGEKLSEGIGGALRKALGWASSDDGKASGAVGGLTALLGGGLGLWLNRHSQHKWSKALLMAVLGGGLGAGATAYSRNKHRRREAYLAKNASTVSPVAQSLMIALENDVTLGAWQRAQMLRAIARLKAEERNDLYRLMRGSIGVGAGVLMARFLGFKGLLPTLGGGILGGALSGVNPASTKYNRMGQLSIMNYM